MRSKFLAVSAFLSIGLAACGGSGSTGPTFATKIDSATASSIASDAGSFASDIADAIVSGNPKTDIGSLLPAKGITGTHYMEQLLANMRTEAYRRAHRSAPAGSRLAAPNFSAPFSTCVPILTGDGVDTDADGIPDHATVTFPANCISSDSAGTYTILWTGSAEIRDLPGLYAYRVDAHNLREKYTEVATGNYEQVQFNGFETATYAASGISHETDMTYALAFSSSGNVASVSFVYKETSAYAPVSAISLANPIPSGDLTFSFDYRILASQTGQPDQNFRFTMTTSTALHYDNSSCFGITSGAIHGLLNGGSTTGFDITWTGCGTYTVTTFGTTEPAV